MASSAVAGGAAASMELVSSTTISRSVSRASASSSTSSSSSSSCSTRAACSSKTNVCGMAKEQIALCQNRTARGTRTLSSLSLSSASALQTTRLSSGGRRGRGVGVAVTPSVVHVRANSVGENPDWADNDIVVVGLAHCFKKDDNQKLVNSFIVEPIPAGGLECMDNGGVTCYLHATGTNLGTVLKQDISLLPPEFKEASFCEDFPFRAMCASRTWKRDHPQEKLRGLVPWDGTVRSDWNFNLTMKRVLNQEHVVKDSDNIKQDLSIDVYGRTEQEEGMTAEIEKLYSA